MTRYRCTKVVDAWEVIEVVGFRVRLDDGRDIYDSFPGSTMLGVAPGDFWVRYANGNHALQ